MTGRVLSSGSLVKMVVLEALVFGEGKAGRDKVRLRGGIIVK
jgi:hypothetical protein